MPARKLAGFFMLKIKINLQALAYDLLMKNREFIFGKTYLLSELKVGCMAESRELKIGDDQLKSHLSDMGLTIGTILKIKKVAPFGDPMCIYVRGYELGLRIEELKHIVVRLIK